MQALARKRKARGKQEGDIMEKTLITINRQHGSGGTQVAKILADRLNVWYYNREILYLAAEEIGYDSLDESSMESLNYKKASKYMEGLSLMFHSTRNNIPVYNQMYQEQSKIIKKLAGYGSGVFLGRCADYVLKDEPGVCSVYLYAPVEYRVKHLSEVEGRQVTVEEIRKEDKNRSSYYEYYTGRDWNDMQNYDLAIDLSKVDAEKAADLILDYMEKRK